MRSNVTVGPPIEVLIYDPRKPRAIRHMVFGPDDDYLRELGRSWQGYVEKAFSVLPPLPPRPTELLRVVDE
jgi:putative proteasome-type protease